MADMTNNDISGQGAEFAGAPSQAEYDAEKAEVQLVLKLWEQGKQARKEMDKDWDTRWDFYKGKQYGGAEGKTSQSVGDRLTGGPMREQIDGRKSLK